MSPRPCQPSFAPRSEADAVSFEVVVVPRASRSRIVGLHDGRLKVSLAAPPVEGEANAELCATLAKALGVAKRAVSIIHGQHGKQKTVRVDGASAEQVMRLSQSIST
jgi:uncharacterized protein (TIGR00251 family)